MGVSLAAVRDDCGRRIRRHGDPPSRALLRRAAHVTGVVSSFAAATSRTRVTAIPCSVEQRDARSAGADGAAEVAEVAKVALRKGEPVMRAKA